MRLTNFWERMADHFGAAYADSFARDHVMAELGGRTVHEALDSRLGGEGRLAWGLRRHGNPGREAMTHMWEARPNRNRGASCHSGRRD